MNRKNLLSVLASGLIAAVTTTGCGEGVDESTDTQPEVSVTEEAGQPEVDTSQQELTSVISCSTDSYTYCRSLGYRYSSGLTKCYWSGRYLVKKVTCY